MYETEYSKSIISLKKELGSKLPMKEEYARVLEKKFRLEFNYNSNNMEGNTLTYGQTEMILLFDKSIGDAKVSDIEEMKAHDVARFQIMEMAKDCERPLTEQFIKELNRTILVKPYWKDAITADKKPTQKLIEIGQYKGTPNSVRLRNGEIHNYASPEETPSKMTDLMFWYNQHKDTMPPVQLAAEFHYRFVYIHPFDDGNGRVARLLMNYILLRNNFPPVIIKSADKDNYLTALQKADTGNLPALIEYIEKQARWSLELYIKAANGEDIEEDDDFKKELAILKREKLDKIVSSYNPKEAGEVINHTNDYLWIPLGKELNEFIDFFAEIEDLTIVDGSSRKAVLMIGRKQIEPWNLFSYGKSEKLKYQAFEYDLEEKKIHTINWRRIMRALKTSSNKVDYKIECYQHLDEANYQISIWVNSKNIFDKEYKYNQLLMSDEVKDIIKFVSNYLIKEIREEK